MQYEGTAPMQQSRHAKTTPAGLTPGRILVGFEVGGLVRRKNPVL